MVADREFSDWVRGQLRTLDLQQADVVKRSQGLVTSAHLSRVLSGQRNPGLDAYEGIAKGLGMPLEAVLRAAGVLPAVGQVDGEDELLAYYRDLPEIDRRRLLDSARSLWTTDRDYRRR